MRFEQLEQAMSDRLPSLGKRLRQLASHALAHPDEMGRETVATLARRLAAPPSSLVRFAQTFGFRGYRDMQRVFRSRGASSAIVEQLVQADIDALEALRKQPHARELVQIAKLMSERNVVYLLASPSWFPVACYLSYALANLTLRSVLVSAVGGMHIEQLSSAGLGDLLLVLEPEDCSAPVVQAASAAAERGASLAVFTSRPSLRLAKRAQTRLTLPRPTVGTPRSLATLMTLGVTLVVTVGHARARRDSATTVKGRARSGHRVADCLRERGVASGVLAGLPGHDAWPRVGLIE